MDHYQPTPARHASAPSYITFILLYILVFYVLSLYLL